MFVSSHLTWVECDWFIFFFLGWVVQFVGHINDGHLLYIFYLALIFNITPCQGVADFLYSWCYIWYFCIFHSVKSPLPFTRKQTYRGWRKVTPKPASIAWRLTASALCCAATCALACRRSSSSSNVCTPQCRYMLFDTMALCVFLGLDWKVLSACSWEGEVPQQRRTGAAFTWGVRLC